MLFSIMSTDKKVTYCLADVSNTFIDSLTGYVVADFNSDGLLDLAGFHMQKYQIVVYYNLLPNPTTGTICKKLVSEDMEEVLKFTKSGSLFSDDLSDYIGIKSKEDETVIASFPVNIQNYSFPLFSRPWAGDINQDGFADLIMTFNNGGGKTIPILFLNQKCSFNETAVNAVDSERDSKMLTNEDSVEKCIERSFPYAWEVNKNYETIKNFTTAQWAFFHDAEDNGI